MPSYELTQREKDSLSKADRLNAIMSQSSIPQAAAAAQIRAREQAAERLQRSRQSSSRANDMELLAVKEALDNRGGPFEGTSIESQMLNIMLDPNIPNDDPRKIAARQRLERERTLTTPEGVERIPGYDFGSGGEQPQGDFTPRNPSGDEKRGELALAQITGASPGTYRPSLLEEGAQEILPAFMASLFTSNDYAKDLTEQRQFLANLIYLQSGATASPDEVEKRRLEFFPQNNDSNDVIQKKQRNLEAFKRDAAASFQSRSGSRPGDEYLR